MNKNFFSRVISVTTPLALVLVLGLGASAVRADEVTGSVTTGLGIDTGLGAIVIVAPSASPIAGTYHSSQSVTLTAAGSTSIRYSTDGSTPTCSTGSVYSSAMSVTGNTTLKAIACYLSALSSSVMSVAYTFTCTTSSVTNGVVSAYPTCAITCNAGYSLSGGACTSDSSGGSGGGGGGGGGSGGSGGGGGGGGGGAGGASGGGGGGAGVPIFTSAPASVTTTVHVPPAPVAATSTTSTVSSSAASVIVSSATNTVALSSSGSSNMATATAADSSHGNVSAGSQTCSAAGGVGVLNIAPAAAYLHDQIKSDAKLYSLNLNADTVEFLARFIQNGADCPTVALGAGERRAVIRDALETIGPMGIRLADLEAMTEGQIPHTRNLPAERIAAKRALTLFRTVYAQAPVFKIPEQNLFWNTLMYRIRFPRNLVLEKRGIVAFRTLFKHTPADPIEWAVVRGLGYVKK